MKGETEVLKSGGETQYCKRSTQAKNPKDFMVCIRPTYTSEHEVHIGVFKRIPQEDPQGEATKYDVTFERIVTQPFVDPKEQRSAYQGTCRGDSGGAWWFLEKAGKQQKAFALAVQSFGSVVCGSYGGHGIAMSLADKETLKWIIGKAGDRLSHQYVQQNEV